ncbi:hypothetical protein LX36DRAFT_752801 [Colletotrichum falcatum]|nr:hypothetical protein LX36DRAFT_752801 [Colletotrichum falcatum]
MDISLDINTVGVPLLMGKPYATDDVWNCHRSIITRLYREENKSLKQVKQIMERDYNLFATERMFKTRIKSWGLDKKLKEAEVLRMLRLKRERDAAGKKSRFSIRDQEVDWERVAHYLSRRPDLRNESRNLHQDSMAARLDVVCRTPSPGPSARALLDGPPEMRLPDEMLRIFRNYVQGAWESLWKLRGHRLYGHNRKRGQDRIGKIFFDLGNARTLLKQNKLPAAFRIINQSLDSLGRVIKDQQPETFYLLSRRVLMMGDRLAEPLIVFISEMHTAVSRTATPPYAQFFETRLGIQNRVVSSAFDLMNALLHSLGETDGREFRIFLSKYAAAAETYLAEGDALRSCKCLFELAWVQLNIKQYETASDALSRAFTLVQDGDRGPGSRWLVMELRYYELMGDLLYQHFPGRIAESLEYGYKAYEHAKKHFQPGSSRSLRVLRNLIYRYRRAGRGEEADKWCEVLLAVTSEDEDL